MLRDHEPARHGGTSMMTMPVGVNAAGVGGGGRSSDDSGPDENFSAALTDAVKRHFDDHLRRTRERSNGVLPVETADDDDAVEDSRSVPHHVVQSKMVKAMLDGASEIVGAVDKLATDAAKAGDQKAEDALLDAELAVGVAALELAAQALNGQLTAAQLQAAAGAGGA